MTDDIKWRTDALRECWEKQMTPLQCAKHIGITRSQVYSIFSGKAWKSIPKPEGFVYPFPSLPRKRVRSTEEKVEMLRLYVEKHMTPQEFAATLGINLHSTYLILNGFRWKDIERPPGFCYPWPDRFWDRKPKIPREPWSRRARK